MEAPIRQGHLASTQKELSTPYKQQVQAPVFATHSAGRGRGVILEMIKRSQELQRQTTTIGRGQGLSTKSQGAPPQVREAPGQDPQGQTQGRSWSHLQKGFEKRRSHSTPRGRAYTSFSGAPSAPPVQLGCFRPRHPADFRGEGWKKDAQLAYLYHISVTLDVTCQGGRGPHHSREQTHGVEQKPLALSSRMKIPCSTLPS